MPLDLALQNGALAAGLVMAGWGVAVLAFEIFGAKSGRAGGPVAVWAWLAGGAPYAFLAFFGTALFTALPVAGALLAAVAAVSYLAQTFYGAE